MEQETAKDTSGCQGGSNEILTGEEMSHNNLVAFIKSIKSMESYGILKASAVDMVAAYVSELE